MRSGDELSGTPFPADVPFAMLISTNERCDSVDDICSRTYPAYEQNMKDVAAQWPDHSFVEVPAAQEIYRDDPAAAQQAVADVLVRARTGPTADATK